MLVGEIGISRHEFLYELRLWEIILITRGYVKRYHAGWEQARLVAYHAAFAMGSKHTPPIITQWYPLPWEKELQADNLPSDEEVEETRAKLQAMNAMNAKNEAQQ